MAAENANGEINKSWMALFVALSMIWFGVSFILPFTNIDINYAQILIDERIFNRGTFGDGISDFIVGLHDSMDVWFKQSYLWSAVINWSTGYADSFVIQQGVKNLNDQVSLILYRLSAMIALLVFAMPFGIALMFDAYWFREIGKWRFFQPSPAIHRTGQVFGIFALITSFIILMAIPFIMVPIVFILLGVLMAYTGFWFWIAHTQKRI